MSVTYVWRVGDGPIGTELSNTCKPSLDHFPIGSKLTPRLMSACARSLRRALNVFVRIVTGRGISFASKNSIAWDNVSTTLQGSLLLKNLPHSW